MLLHGGRTISAHPHIHFHPEPEDDAKYCKTEQEAGPGRKQAEDGNFPVEVAVIAQYQRGKAEDDERGHDFPEIVMTDKKSITSTNCYTFYKGLRLSISSDTGPANPPTSGNGICLFRIFVAMIVDIFRCTVDVPIVPGHYAMINDKRREDIRVL